MATRVIHVKADRDVSRAASEGARALRAGHLVGFATETVYGISAMATDAAAMERLREVKSRPSRPFSVHLGRVEDVGLYVRDIPGGARRLISKAWPGPVTLLLAAHGRLADARLNRAGLYSVLCSDDLVGLRCPRSDVAQAMLSEVDSPVVAASANSAGAAPPRTAEDVLESMEGRIDLLIDSGPTRYGKDSTIVRFTNESWEIVRKGVYQERTIRKLLKQTLLFVCTGNTCRSPIAAGLARKLIAERLGCKVEELQDKGVEVLSAGVMAANGGKASLEAVESARPLGVDISAHRTRKLTSELINAADVVFCMTDSHVAQAREMSPWSADKVRRLWAGGDVPDPAGGGTDVYHRTARRIEEAVKMTLDKEMP